MRRIVEANINRFKLLLESEADPAKREIEKRLLAEEQAKLKELLDSAEEKKAF